MYGGIAYAQIMADSRDETKDLDVSPSTSATQTSGQASGRVTEAAGAALRALRARVVWAMLAAGAIAALVLAFVLPTSDRAPESHAIFAAFVMRRSGPELVDKSVGGLHAGEFLADVRVEIASGEPLPGQGWLGIVPRVRDRASFTVSAEGGAAGSTGVSADTGRAFLADDNAVRAVVARAVDRIHPALQVGTLIERGTPERSRIQLGSAVRSALLTVAIGLSIAAGVVWVLPRVKAMIRARAIERGECPKCRLGLANLRDRRCPKCGLEVTPGEFNRLRAVWRTKGVGG